MNTPSNITLAVTGASGAIYAAEMLRALSSDERVERIDFVPSEASLRVFAEELSFSGRTQLAEKLLGAPCAKLRHHAESDIGASIASGSPARNEANDERAIGIWKRGVTL